MIIAAELSDGKGKTSPKNGTDIMQSFKLTPKPQSDYRLDINEIKKKCTVEKHGYRHDKIIFGFCDELPDITELQSLGLKIEDVAFDKARVSLMSDLVERGRTKSKIDHLKHEQTENGEMRN